MRVVSLTCSNTEIVAALGYGGHLVGVDDHSDWPPQALEGVARVGKDLQIDVAKVVALRPDLVLASLTVPGHERVVAEVAAAGLPYVAPDPESLDDVYRDIRQIAALIDDVPAGEALVAKMKAAMPPVTPRSGRPRVLVEWWPRPVYAPGRLSWVTDLIALAGGVNPLGDRDARSLVVDDDLARELAPDHVVISWCGVPTSHYRPDLVARRPAWQGLPAVQHGRIVPIPEAFLGRPGPRLVAGYEALRALLEAP